MEVAVDYKKFQDAVQLLVDLSKIASTVLESIRSGDVRKVEEVLQSPLRSQVAWEAAELRKKEKYHGNE